MKSSNNQFNPYTVVVKKARGYSDYDTARLQISVGQPYHEGDKFAATVEWAQSRFEKVIICVNDTLQRHNLRFEKGLPDVMALRMTEQQGREWVDRNLSSIKNLSNYEIQHWEEWRKRPSYEALLEKNQHLYDGQKHTRDCIDAIIKDFWDRRIKRQGFSEEEKFVYFHQHSTNYFLEELTVFQMMFSELDAADIYPGSCLLPMVLAQKPFTRIGFDRKDPDNLLRKKA